MHGNGNQLESVELCGDDMKWMRMEVRRFVCCWLEGSRLDLLD